MVYSVARSPMDHSDLLEARRAISLLDKFPRAQRSEVVVRQALYAFTARDCDRHLTRALWARTSSATMPSRWGMVSVQRSQSKDGKVRKEQWNLVTATDDFHPPLLNLDPMVHLPVAIALHLLADNNTYIMGWDGHADSCHRGRGGMSLMHYFLPGELLTGGIDVEASQADIVQAGKAWKNPRRIPTIHVSEMDGNGGFVVQRKDVSLAVAALRMGAQYMRGVLNEYTVSSGGPSVQYKTVAEQFPLPV